MAVLSLSSGNPTKAKAKMIGAVVILLPSLCSAFSASGGASIRPVTSPLPCPAYHEVPGRVGKSLHQTKCENVAR
jgi:hypothetical protein